MRALVTGPSGLVGAAVVRRLVQDGHEVIGADASLAHLALLAEVRHSKRLVLHRADPATGQLRDLVTAERPDVVLHLSGRGRLTDVVGTVGLLRGCYEAGVARVVAASSGAVYGGASRGPLTERMTRRPVDRTGAGWLATEGYLEAFAQELGLAVATLRLGTAYGPGSGGAVGEFTSALLAGRPTTVHGDGSTVRDFVHVDDVVDAVVRCLGGRADGRELNVGTGVGTTVRRLHTLVAQAAGVPDAPAFGAARPGEVGAVVLDSGQARRALGWEALIGLEQGLARTVDAFRSGQR